MGKKTRCVLSLILLAGAALACGPVYGQHGDDRDNGHGPAIFVMTNAADRNEVISYKRNGDGTLTEERHFSTAGRGSGGNNDPLESQGSLTLTQDHSHLLAVNAAAATFRCFASMAPISTFATVYLPEAANRTLWPSTVTSSMSSTPAVAATS
jgi:6-phosphogluconolactonase